MYFKYNDVFNKFVQKIFKSDKKMAHNHMKKKISCIVIIFILLLSTVTPLSVFGKWKPEKPKKPKKPAKEISIFVNYMDSPLFGADYIVEGLAWILYDGLDNVIASGTTDSNGMIIFKIKDDYDLSGDGIHLEYTWRGDLESINNLVAGTTELELQGFKISSHLYWADGLNPAEIGDVEVWFNGEYLTTVALISGELPELNLLLMNNVIAGTYTIKGAFIDYVININVAGEEIYGSDILLSAEGFLTSRILGFLKKGEFFYLHQAKN